MNPTDSLIPKESNKSNSKIEYVKIVIMAMPIVLLAIIGFSMFPKTHDEINEGIYLLSCPTLLKAQNEFAFTLWGNQDEIQKQIKVKNCLGDKP